MNSHVDAETHLDATPDAVISFIGDVRNRLQYVPALTDIGDVQGDVEAGTQTWTWKFSVLGLDLQGRAHCTAYEAGRLYAFETEDGAKSTWRYQAESEGNGTHLTLHVDYEIPDAMLSQLPPLETLHSMAAAEAKAVFANLEAILGQKTA